MRRRNNRLDLLLRTVDIASGEARRAVIEAIHRECWASLWGLRGRARVERRQLDRLFARLVHALETDEADVVRTEAAYGHSAARILGWIPWPGRCNLINQDADIRRNGR